MLALVVCEERGQILNTSATAARLLQGTCTHPLSSTVYMPVHDIACRAYKAREGIAASVATLAAMAVHVCNSDRLYTQNRRNPNAATEA